MALPLKSQSDNNYLRFRQSHKLLPAQTLIPKRPWQLSTKSFRQRLPGLGGNSVALNSNRFRTQVLWSTELAIGLLS